MYNALRVLHVLSGSLWLGEVVLLNVLLLPVLIKSNDSLRNTLLRALLPKIIHLASLFSIVFAATGIVLALHSGAFFTSPYLMVAIILLTLLASFHFFMGYRIFMPKLAVGSHEKIASIYRIVQVVPRIGLLIIAVIVGLLLYSAPLYLF